jgi:hypothetical protein
MVDCDRIVDPVLTTGAAGSRPSHDFAGLTEAEAQSRIAGIGFDQNAQTMARRAHIRCVEYGVRAALTFDRKHPLFGVRSFPVNVISRNALDRLVGVPVNVWVGITP